MIRIQIRDNEPLEKTLRRLRKLCNNEGITKGIKRSAYYEKPSEKRRRRERERQKAIRLANSPKKKRKVRRSR
jgi:small subunit ribosomal protein S21